MKQDKLKAYASVFASHLLKNLEDSLSDVERIILYGSVAKGESSKESDVDIFIDTEKDLKKKIEGILRKFYKSREATLFRIQGVENKINVKVGKLKEWEELHRSIASTGIVLWGPFEMIEMPIGAKHKIVFYWDSVGKNRGAFLNKLYGFKAKGKAYSGLLEKWGARKLGKSCVLIPIKNKEEMIELIKKYEVNAKSIEFFSLD